MRGRGGGQAEGVRAGGTCEYAATSASSALYLEAGKLVGTPRPLQASAARSYACAASSSLSKPPRYSCLPVSHRLASQRCVSLRAGPAPVCRPRLAAPA